MTKNFDFIDDPAAVQARIATQEARLGLPKSEPQTDILQANTVLRGLELIATPPAPVVTEQPPVPVNSSRQSRNASRYAADGKLHGVELLAAHYAKRTHSPVA